MTDITDEARGAAVATVRRQLHPDATRNFVMANGYAHRIVDALIGLGWRPPVSPLTDEASRAYQEGRWCGECRYGVVEDPPCCTGPSPLTVDAVADVLYDAWDLEEGDAIPYLSSEARAKLAAAVVAEFGPLTDRAEVEREAAAKALEDAAEHITSDYLFRALRARAAEIREGGTRG